MKHVLSSVCVWSEEGAGIWATSARKGYLCYFRVWRKAGDSRRTGDCVGWHEFPLTEGVPAAAYCESLRMLLEAGARLEVCMVTTHLRQGEACVFAVRSAACPVAGELQLWAERSLRQDELPEGLAYGVALLPETALSYNERLGRPRDSMIGHNWDTDPVESCC